MVNGISTYGQSTNVLAQITNLESQQESLTLQESSGLKSQTFDGIAPVSLQVLDLSSQYSQLTNFTSEAQNAQYKVNETGNVLSSLSTLLNSALTTISSALTSTGSTSNAITTNTTQIELQQDLQDMASQLNTQYAGNYLFSGSAINTEPVNLQAAGYTGLTATTANTSYYQGDDDVASVKVTGSLTVSYGITADNSAFEQALRGLSIAANNPSDATSLQDAFTLLKQAANGISTLSAQNTTKYNALEDQINTNTSSLNYLDTNISDLTNADVTAVTTNLNDLSTQLSAAYTALSKLLQLNLASYLKS